MFLKTYDVLLTWSSNKKIIVYPAYITKVYYYYFSKQGHYEISQNLIPLENTDNLSSFEYGTLLVVMHSKNPKNKDELPKLLELLNNNYLPLRYNDIWLNHSLYIRTHSSH